ncbi:GAF domain-containing protein [Spirosoma sp. KNUC1025]|uniref:GAF domain-containing protein n=1 Tax=Spirosoma sp. KNUC1025 TaxID=2894082 RepID=UPI00386AC58F|nr:GAF domain-containing protein [Spirosoma sp. KNUC1025]
METRTDELKEADLSPKFRLSFKPFVDYLEKQLTDNECSVEGGHLREYLIQKANNVFLVENQPEKGYDPDRLSELFQLITFSVLPLTKADQDIPYAFGLPEPLQLFHYSPAFERLMTRNPGFLPMDIKVHVDPDEKLRFGYRMILQKCYDVQVAHNQTFLPFQRDVNGLTTYYRINIDSTFMAPRPRYELPPLDSDWVDFANGFIKSSKELSNPLPIDAFIVEGFAFFIIEDVTETETIQQLREIFAHLQSEPEPVIYNRFERTLRNLGGQADLQIGIMPFVQVNGRYVHYPDFDARSVFLNHSGLYPNHVDQSALERIIRYIGRNGKPTVTPDLAQAPGSHLRALYKNGIRSFLFYPIRMGNQLLGVLEMGSPHTNALNGAVLQKFETVLPLIQELLLYQRSQFNAALDRMIKQQFTNLQPAVEWKFNEAAWLMMLGKKRTSHREADLVRFPKVYPIYGAIDIRNSSVERHKAIEWDLSQQLNTIKTILDCPIMPDDLLMPDLLLGKVKHWQKRLSAGLDSDDEAEITLFLTEEIHPYLEHLQSNHADLGDSIEQYFSKVDQTTGQFHQALHAYERSVKWLNTTVKDYVGQAEEKLQQIYPHYAESFRTDGLEYTLYVGQSIAPKQPFEPDHLQQLYAWQLSSMVDIARLTHRLRPHLPLPLQTTQLILAHSQPVDINFRQDEHRFDVEGSYSIRYEVVKKRIDKAYILDTHERLTQPGTIALVYANHQDVAPYLPLIETMRDQQQIQPTVDQIELEPLQGVFGMKALRLHINFD